MKPSKADLSKALGVSAIILSFLLAMNLLETYNPSASMMPASNLVVESEESVEKKLLLTVHVLEEESFRFSPVPRATVVVIRLGPLDNSTQEVNANPISEKTDSKGFVYFLLPEGRYLISAEHFGIIANITLKLYESFEGFVSFIFHQKTVKPLFIHLYDNSDQDGILDANDRLAIWYKSEPGFQIHVAELRIEDVEPIYLEVIDLKKTDGIYGIILAPTHPIDVRFINQEKYVTLTLKWVTVKSYLGK